MIDTRVDLLDLVGGESATREETALTPLAAQTSRTLVGGRRVHPDYFHRPTDAAATQQSEYCQLLAGPAEELTTTDIHPFRPQPKVPQFGGNFPLKCTRCGAVTNRRHPGRVPFRLS